MLDPVIAVAPGGRARLRLSSGNCVASEIRGEAQVISPYDTWGLPPPVDPGFRGRRRRGDGAPITVAPPVGTPAGSWWALIKIMYFGRALYTESIPVQVLPSDARTVTDPIRFGVLAWPQYTDWPSLLQVGRRVEELGYDALWTWDHPYPIRGDEHGPSFEGYMTLAAWAGVTEHVTLGHMVTANPLRSPALLAKSVDARPHERRPRDPGIGAGWNVAEFESFGVEPGLSMGERIDWLDEAVALMRAMFDGQEATAGPHYTSRAVRNILRRSNAAYRSSSAGRASARRCRDGRPVRGYVGDVR